MAWKEDPDLSIGVSMSSNAWQAKSRYNALHISKKIVPIVTTLHDEGLIDLAKHSHHGPGDSRNRTTRIRAAEPLRKLFRKAKFNRDDIGRAEGEEVIILKNSKNKQIEYDDNADTSRMRGELTAYNTLIANTFIDIPDLQEPVIEVGDNDEKSLVRTHRDHTRTHRVFSRSSWDMHGRFYGGWWQQVGSDTRARITIDDQPTVEVDFVGLHIAMLYAEAGQKLDFDPYHIPRKKMPAYPEKLIRKLTKRLALIAINAKDKTKAYQAFREGYPTGNIGSRIRNSKLDELLELLLEKNPCLKGKLFTDQGIRLMNLDAQITARIHNHFTDKGIPILSVHDSYLINCWKVGELRTAMADATKAVVGRSLATSIKLPGKEEYQWVSDKDLQTYIDNKLNPPRCDGYVERLQTFEKRTGRDIGPYDGDPRLMDGEADDGDPDWEN
ncbi:hypothetical protein [Sulfitobacter geojensis]|uniref:Uncharacterized protein n=1 Tax=Sulfitobacter geojensis TaxID=1342299 RepID=A0AAE2W291_9RHOB|nr:hypothetical protein [Sulfitobacter geojensis]MBM1690701.1 hypothetical protein [Sulfitobacter geojensis]MBM1694767.1 hypothetical protein [Sulfitobacter geojensis]MBM1707867.1 hypothetical protein [Sulfitobacter geojensis]MBM1711137.1 hypothetical protein [Sulfitobacter geojensis]MBM1716000.1 hypothetical protein [Sulfitobacter geojensis]